MKKRGKHVHAQEKKSQLKLIPTLALTDIKAALIRIFMGLKQKMMTQNDKKMTQKIGNLSGEIENYQTNQIIILELKSQ